ncbi:MAG: DNA polymerase III subunit alpha, partial [Candidatus Levybacteria bacterium]|nr:DNA polymerase III subunit alpha [Candidatus Levybacteria bacterium]
MATFTHLHNHSEYSLLDGLSKIENMVAQTKALGMESIAITDHGNMYGTIKFYKEARAQGIKPIIGCEIYVAKRSLTDKEAGIDNEYNHLILLAENNTGYKNLMKIVSVSNLDGYYYKPRSDIALLEKYSEGLICLTACVNGYIGDPLLNNREDEAEKRLKTLLRIFGDNNVFLELQKHLHVPPQEPLNEKLLEMSRKFGVPIVATNDNHYIHKNDAEAQEILLAIQTQTTILDTNRKLSMIDSPDFYIKSPAEMEALFIKTPDAVTNAAKIGERCNVEITLGKWILPQFSTPNKTTPAEYLAELVQEGLINRYKEVTPAIQERVDYEIAIITKKGYETYFLTVSDFVNWAKANGISVGPGRGSAAGSVVSFALGITDVDPFYFSLPFERFLNPDRPSAPDIDLDFADTRRDEVISYVTKKYGEDKVAQIITFGTMEARGAVRDAGRALGMPYAAPDRISKMIPPGWQGHAMTLEKALEQSPDLKRAYLTENDTKRLLDVAQKLEGVARHASVHAAGVVIADKPLTDYTPLQRETNGEKVVTQYDMYTVGEDGVGLLKMDFLGLRNLTIIEEALRFIKQNKGVEINLTDVPLDDHKTYDLLSSAETTGIFQLESPGMRRYIKELKPTTIFDLMAMVALYRPGPMQNIPDFITRKHNPSMISYPDPRLETILKNSYGILTFQDDVLLTTMILAGYSWLDADKFRKAMGKKIPAEMKKQKDIFLTGAVKNGLNQRKAEEIFELIAPFAGYGFNKAHAACYATIAFRTAYLKAHYPVEFMTALLTAESRGTTGPAKNEKV